MTRGISPGEPGWHFVPVVAVVAAPLTVSLFAVAMAYELVRRLPFGNRLGARESWIIAVAIVAGLFTTAGGTRAGRRKITLQPIASSQMASH